MNNKERFLNGIKWTSLSSIINTLAKLGQMAVLARFLAKDDFGLMAIALLFLSFTDIFIDMGFTSAVLHRQNISEKEYSSLFWFNIFCGFFFSILLYLCAPVIAAYYKDDRLINIISLLSLIPLLSSLFKLQVTIHQKKMQFKFITSVEIISSVLMVSLSIVLAYLKFMIYALVIANLFYYLLIAGIYLVYSIFLKKNIKFHFSLYEIKPFLKIGIYRVGSSILNYFSGEMDIIFISSIYSLEILGVYSLCKQLTQKVGRLINPVITKVLSPALSLLQTSRDSIKLKYIQVIKVLSISNTPIFFLLVYTSAFVLNILYGESYVKYATILSILAINSLLNSISNPIGSLLIALGKTNIEFFLTIYRIIITFIFLMIGSRFNIYVLIFIFLFITVINVSVEVIFIYKKLINFTFSEFVVIVKNPIIVSMILFPVLFLQYVFKNKYIGICVIFVLFLVTYLFYYVVVDRTVFLEICRYLNMDHFKILKKLTNRIKNV